MRSFLRLAVATATLLAAAASMAQYPYQLVVQGTMTPCTPGNLVTVQTIQGTDPEVTVTAPLDQNCHYSVIIGVNSANAYVMATSSCGGGFAAMESGSAQFNNFLDTALVTLNLVCQGGQLDCMGILNGPNMPGTACTTFFNQPGTWSPDCICIGDTMNVTYDCLQIPNGPNMPGTPCDDNNPMTDSTYWNVWCQCVQDTTQVYAYDCLGILNGPNMPGTACTTFFNQPGTWSPDCICIGDTMNVTYDCLQIPNGPNMPGTPCNVPGTNLYGIWSADCVCEGDTINVIYDCLQVPNGPNMPGTPCTIPGTTLQGIWSAQCVCENAQPCNADFWVLPAYGNDSTPQAGEVWVWNLSSGGVGPYTFLWNFGDGTSSTDAFPTHQYSDNGPYLLCLTMTDANSCTSTHCDSVGVDENGFYTGIMGGNGDRSNGFTLNVLNALPTGVIEHATAAQVSLWPNPADNELHVGMSHFNKGVADVSVVDLEGRTVIGRRTTLTGGADQFTMDVSGLGQGMYVVRVSTANGVTTQRFVKH